MDASLQALAAKFTHTKFLRIISTDCIPNYPDRNLPTLLVYKDTQCKHSLVGATPFGGRITPESALNLDESVRRMLRQLFNPHLWCVCVAACISKIQYQLLCTAGLASTLRRLGPIIDEEPD